MNNYRVLRDHSFMGDLGPDFIVNDYYLKAVAVQDQEVPDLSAIPTAYCLVKIVSMKRIPQPHRNMLLNESTKIMRYFSTTEYNARIHKLLDICMVDDSNLYMFFENLHEHKSLYTVVHGVPKEFRFPPPARASNTMLTLAKMQLWMHELAKTVELLSYHGLAHRYIRPEYVYINEQDHSKVGERR